MTDDHAGHRYRILIQGTTDRAVEVRRRGLTLLLEETLKVKQIHRLPNWSKQHRIGLMDSSVIAAHELNTKAIVLFHHSDATSLAEVVSCKYTNAR